MILLGEIKELSVRAEGDRVILLQDGRLVVSMPIAAARALIRALQVKTLEAEEENQAQAIAYDQAVLLRSGIPLGLSLRRDIQHEARQLAAWDSDLRRYIVKKKHVNKVGQPTIIGGA